MFSRILYLRIYEFFHEVFFFFATIYNFLIKINTDEKLMLL